MIRIEIPGIKTVEVHHLVLDYNGTIALDGTLIPGVKEMLNGLSEKLEVHIVTADTFGKAAENLKGVNCTLTLINSPDQRSFKKEYVMKLGKEITVSVGNGANDEYMLAESAIGIVLIQKEGACSKSVMSADIVCGSILEAIDLLNNPLRIAATLRV